MKIDSDWLDIDVNPEFSIIEGKTKSGRGIEIWDDGDISIFVGDIDIMLRVEELIEIGRIYKFYKTRRDTFLAKKD